MRKITLVYLLLISCTLLNAQTVFYRDSLLKLLPVAKQDTNKVELLYRLAKYYEMNNQDSATYYLSKTWDLSETLKYTKGKYLFYERSAVVSFTKGNYSKAMEESNKGLLTARELKDSSLVIVMLNNIAITYGYIEKYHEQLDYTLQVKRQLKTLKTLQKYRACIITFPIATVTLGKAEKQQIVPSCLFTLKSS